MENNFKGNDSGEKTIIKKSFPNLKLISFKSILLALFFLIASHCVTAQTPVAVNGKLKVVGTQLVNKNGVAVQLRGMSSHGVQWYTEDYNFNSLSTLVHTWRIDVFRIAMYPTDQPDATGNSYEGNPTFWRNYVDNLVDICGKLGVYCIIDWHVLTPGDPTNSSYYQMAKDFWAYMSLKHAGKDQVLYEICNEPNGVSWSTVKSYAQTIIPIIRQNDPNTIILCGSPTWSSDVDIAAGDPITGVTNLMYSFHFYAASHGQNYRDKITTALSKGLPIFVTEWGSCDASGTGSNNWTETNTWMSFLQTNKISWCNWSYSDKNETAATLVPGSGAMLQWNNTNAQGNALKALIATPADSWISSGNWIPASNVASPINGAYALVNKAITLKADAVDKDGTIASVDFMANGSLIGTSTTSPYSIQWTPATAANYVITAVAKDNTGATGTSLGSTLHIVSTLPTETAYPSGTPWAIPGDISCLNFDNGGEMVAYHDLDAVHKGPKTGNSRQTEGVDIEGSANIGYVLTGEWLKYTVNIANAGSYDFTIQTASGLTSGGKIHLEIDDVAVSAVTIVPSSNNWGSYQPTVIKDVPLPSGTHILKLYFDQGSVNVSTMNFKAGPTAITANAGPDQNVVDQNSDGKETILLDGSASTDNGGTISSYIWTENGTQIASGVKPSVILPVGNHTITLKVTDNLSRISNDDVIITVKPSQSPNVAIGKAITVSSTESTNYPGSNAIDGNTATRWSSAFSDPQTATIDLQGKYDINELVLNWEAASGRDFKIDVSSDNVNWTNVVNKVNMPAGARIDDFVATATSIQYVRLTGTARTTAYGYSLYEFEVHGKSSGVNIPVTGVTLAPATASINVGLTQKLTATVTPSNATNQNVSYKSSNTAVATVDATGLVTAVAIGNAIITVTTQDQSKTATSAITVVSIPVTGVTLTPATASINIGSTQQLVAVVTPSNASQNVSYTSSNPSVATVSASGLVTVLTAGNSIITVTTQSGGFTAKSSITVKSIPVTGVSISPLSSTINLGSTQQFVATILPANATNKNVSWTGLSQTGLFTATTVGSFNVSVTTQDGGFIATTTITVVSNSCTLSSRFGVPAATALPSIDPMVVYPKVFVLGTGGPNFGNVTGGQIQWSLQNNGLWVLAISTNNGVPNWYVNLGSITTNTFNSASPACTITGSNIAGLDGSYWVNKDGANFVMVSKSGNFAVYFSTTSTPPSLSCLKSAMVITGVESNDVSNGIELYPTILESNKQLNLKISSDIINNTTLYVYDLNGRKILQKVITESLTTISLSQYNLKGMYWAKIVKDGAVYTNKFIVE